MKIREALALADAQRINGIDEVLKLQWLSELDGRVVREVISPFAEGDFKGYSADTARDTALLIPYPYDSIYPAYLVMNIDRLNNEMQKYNDGADACAEIMEAYRSWYVRTHRATTPKMKFF